MKFAAFRLRHGTPAEIERVRVGLVSTEQDNIAEYGVSTNLTEAGVLTLLNLQLAKQPLPATTTTHSLSGRNGIFPNF